MITYVHEARINIFHIISLDRVNPTPHQLAQAFHCFKSRDAGLFLRKPLQIGNTAEKDAVG